MNLRGIFETSMFGPLVMLVALIRIKLEQGYFKPGRFVGGHFMIPFISNCLRLLIKTPPKQ